MNIKIIFYGGWLLFVLSFFVVCIVYNSPLNAIATFFNVMIAGVFFLDAWTGQTPNQTAEEKEK